MAEDGEVVNEEEVVVPPSVEEGQEVEKTYTETEQRAMAQGWKPKDKWEGDPEDHRSARDFLDRGEMIGTIRSQAKQLAETQKAVNFLSENNRKAYENGVKNTIEALKAQKKAALAEGDLVAADDINDKIEANKEKIVQIRSQPDPVVNLNKSDPDHDVWLLENPWYNNKVLMKFADSLAVDFIEEQTNKGNTWTPQQVRNYVAKTVREEFPEKFQTKKAASVSAPNPDGESNKSKSNNAQSSSALPTNLSKVKAGMPEEHRSIMKTIIKSTGMTEAEYLKTYSEG